MENASGVHWLCMGVTNEAKAQVTLASNSFMNIFGLVTLLLES